MIVKHTHCVRFVHDCPRRHDGLGQASARGEGFIASHSIGLASGGAGLALRLDNGSLCQLGTIGAMASLQQCVTGKRREQKLCNERLPVLRDTINCRQQFVHARDHCDFWPLADSAQGPVMSAQPWIETNRDQNGHAWSAAESSVAEGDGDSPRELRFPGLVQPRYHVYITGQGGRASKASRKPPVRLHERGRCSLRQEGAA
jgi:hypothetical protein